MALPKATSGADALGARAGPGGSQAFRLERQVLPPFVASEEARAKQRKGSGLAARQSPLHRAQLSPHLRLPQIARIATPSHVSEIDLPAKRVEEPPMAAMAMAGAAESVFGWRFPVEINSYTLPDL